MNPNRHFEEGLEMFAEAINAASNTVNTTGSTLPMTNLLKMSLTFVVTLVGLAAAALVYLIYPGIPSKSKVMAFEGLISRDSHPASLSILRISTNRA
jgi:hypothetical protein